jgi:hypothetical protein
MSIAELLILACATWYISFVLTRLPGPFGVFARMRERPQFGIMKCIYCLSFWIAIALYVLMYNDFEELVWILGICGGAHMLASFTGVNYYGNADDS